MSKFSKEYSNLLLRYTAYINEKNLDALKENMDWFNRISDNADKELKTSLKTYDTSTLVRDHLALFIIAKSFTAYAFSIRHESKHEDCINLLEKARTCYELISQNIHRCFDENINLKQQMIKVDFFISKTKYDRARIDYFFLAKQVKTKNIPAEIESNLLKIRNEFQAFRDLLLNKYKDKEFKDELPIDILLNSTGSKLADIDKKVEQPSPIRLGKRRAKEEPPIPEDDEKTVEATTITTSSQSTQTSEKTEASEQPQPKKQKPSTRHKRLKLMDEESETTSPDNPGPFNPFSSAKPTPLLPPKPVSPPIETTSKASNHRFWTTQLPPRYLQDSEKCNIEVKKYIETLPNSKRPIKSQVLEKLGYAMLLAAVYLKKHENSSYKNLDKNPALQMTISLFLKSAELAGSGEDAHRRIFLISKSYTAKFKEFLKPEKLTAGSDLTKLRELYKGEKPLLDLNNLEIEDIVKQLFKKLSEVLPPDSDDYRIVNKVCISTFQKAVKDTNLSIRVGNF